MKFKEINVVITVDDGKNFLEESLSYNFNSKMSLKEILDYLVHKIEVDE